MRLGDDFVDGEFRKWGERRELARIGLSGEVDTSTERCRSRVPPLVADCLEEGRRGSPEFGRDRDGGADTRPPPIRVWCGEGPFIMERRMLPREGANAILDSGAGRPGRSTNVFFPGLLG